MSKKTKNVGLSEKCKLLLSAGKTSWVENEHASISVYKLDDAIY